MTAGDVTSLEGSRVAVVGAGYMGGGIAQVLALAGHPVSLGDIDAEASARARDRLLAEAHDFETGGLMPVGAADIIASRLTAAPSIETAVEGSAFVSEAVTERLDVKAAVLGRIATTLGPSGIVGTNTSAIPIATLSQSAGDPTRFLGVHWMNPAPFIPGVEIIPGPSTSEAVIVAVQEMIGAAGKIATRVADSPGFIANRLQFALYKEACRVVEEGLADPSQVDAVVSSSFGFRLALFGPFAIADMAGLDVYQGAYATLAEAYGDRFTVPGIVSDAVDEGRLGVKTGSGGVLEIPHDQIAELVRYRNEAYARLAGLRSEIGSAPGL